MLTKMKLQTEKGFTLIELMIVVAIIGILAAIAIPQFASYRNKAFNASALSDLHTARLAEEALYTDYQTYGASVPAAGLTIASAASAGLAGAPVTSAAGYVATTTAGQAAAFNLSKGVTLQAQTDAAVTAVAATITAQHAQGDKSYVAETDQSGIYQKTVVVGVAFASVAATAATLDAAAPYSAM